MNEIVHTGVITAVAKNKVTLRLSSAACDGCALRGACVPSARSKKGVDCETPDAENFIPGQTVEVVLMPAQAAGAAFWGYIAPLILVLTVLFTVSAFGGETPAAVLSLGILPVYYLMLWLFRGRLKKALQIKIR